MTDPSPIPLISEADKDAARTAMRRGAGPDGNIPPCTCFDITKRQRDCRAICEDAVDHVAAAIAKARSAA